jgi:hypothetical protein
MTRVVDHLIDLIQPHGGLIAWLEGTRLQHEHPHFPQCPALTMQLSLSTVPSSNEIHSSSMTKRLGLLVAYCPLTRLRPSHFNNEVMSASSRRCSEEEQLIHHDEQVKLAEAIIFPMLLSSPSVAKCRCLAKCTLSIESRFPALES